MKEKERLEKKVEARWKLVKDLLLSLTNFSKEKGGKRLLDKVQIVKRRKYRKWKYRQWEVIDAISPDQYDNYFVIEPKFDEFLNEIKNGVYILLYGPRASGKSTRILYAMQKLNEEGYHCIYLDFTQINVDNDMKTMWMSLYRLMKSQLPKGIVNNEFSQTMDFVDAFYKEKWNGEKVILFFDEFDRMYDKTIEICDDFLGVIRSFKSYWDHVIHSVVIAGPFSIRYLNPKGSHTPPFNVAESFQNPNFTKEQVIQLYQDYASSTDVNIDTSIINDIYNQTNGHAGLVCLCGHAIDEDLICTIENNSLNLDSWIIYCSSNKLQNRITQYPTFTKMISTLKKSKASMDLLRSQFMLNLEFYNVSPVDIDTANFLAAEGVLQPHKEDLTKFKIFSPLIRTLILQCVIPSVYPDHPKVNIPYQDGILDTFNVLKEVVRVFDQDIVFLGSQRSFKTAKNYVNDRRNQHVPRESVYDQEFFRIVFNWLMSNGFSISGQWNLIDGETHQYPDFIITQNKNNSIIVIELVATAPDYDLKNHFRTTMEYAEKLKANEAWVVHFTCADNVIENPTWPIEQEQKDKLHVIHFWHDISFNNVKMAARFPNGEIINEIVI